MNTAPDGSMPLSSSHSGRWGFEMKHQDVSRSWAHTAVGLLPSEKFPAIWSMPSVSPSCLQRLDLSVDVVMMRAKFGISAKRYIGGQICCELELNSEAQRVQQRTGTPWSHLTITIRHAYPLILPVSSCLMTTSRHQGLI